MFSGTLSAGDSSKSYLFNLSLSLNFKVFKLPECLHVINLAAEERRTHKTSLDPQSHQFEHAIGMVKTVVSLKRTVEYFEALEAETREEALDENCPGKV